MTDLKKKRPNADEVLETLRRGNERFVNEKLEHPNHCKESREKLFSHQEPIATVLTCSDSRVPPVDIYDQGLGDLFVVRVAGNIIGDHTLGSIEYAVSHLHTPLVVVMGHASCGAVGAVASGVALEGHIATLTPAIQSAIKHVKETSGNAINNASKELARQMAKKLETSEPIIADLVKENKVKIVAAFYDFHTGEVIFL
jgi:carbonic anhydrase